MRQSKISFSEEQSMFIEKFADLGFKDKSELVRKALAEFQKKLERTELAYSAKLYSEVYQSDSDTKDLTESAVEEWPE